MVERLIDVEDVIGSSPIPRTKQHLTNPMEKNLSENETRELESSKFVERNLEEAAEGGEISTYEWFEDLVIKQEAKVKFGTNESEVNYANILKTNPDTLKDEVVYYTTQEVEVNRLKALQEGKTIIVDGSEVSEEE